MQHDKSSKSTLAASSKIQGNNLTNTFSFPIESNKVGSLYQRGTTINGQVTNTELAIPTNESNTISDLSFQQSLQLSCKSSTTNLLPIQPVSQSWSATSSQSFLDHEKTVVEIDVYVHTKIFLV